MDGYSHHEQKKQDLQVSKKEGLGQARGEELSKDRGKGWVDKRKNIISVYMHAYIYFYTLSANNSALCLGYK